MYRIPTTKVFEITKVGSDSTDSVWMTLILAAMSLLKQIVSFHVHLIFHQTVKPWGQENIGPFLFY